MHIYIIYIHISHPRVPVLPAVPYNILPPNFALGNTFEETAAVKETSRDRKLSGNYLCPDLLSGFSQFVFAPSSDCP